MGEFAHQIAIQWCPDWYPSGNQKTWSERFKRISNYFHLPPDMIEKKHFRLDLIMWKSCSTSAIWHVLRYSFDTDTEDPSVEVETWHVSRVSLSQRCLWHWRLGPSRRVFFHTCLVISVDVVRNLKMYEDIYTWCLQMTACDFVDLRFYGGRFPPWNSLSAFNLQNFNLESTVIFIANLRGFLYILVSSLEGSDTSYAG